MKKRYYRQPGNADNQQNDTSSHQRLKIASPQFYANNPDTADVSPTNAQVLPGSNPTDTPPQLPTPVKTNPSFLPPSPVPSNQPPASTAPPTITPLNQNYDPYQLTNMMANSPYLQKIQQNEQDIERMREMPVTDQDGRFHSAFKAVISGLQRAFDPANGSVRNWGDIGARLAYAGGSALGGAINPAWNEEAQRQHDIAQKQAENKELGGLANQDFNMQQKAAMYGLNATKAQTQADVGKANADMRSRGLDLRETRQKFQQLNAEQKTTLSSIMKRGYYTEGDNKAEDDKLAGLGIVLPDFDTRKPITRMQNGTLEQFNYDNEAWEPAKGVPVDESQVPIEYSVGGVRMKLRPRDIAQVESANIRQDKALKQNDDHFKLTLQFKKDQAVAAQNQFTTTTNLRMQAMKDAQDARASGNERAAQAADQRAKAQEMRLIQIRQAAEKTYKEGNLNEADYNDLIQQIDNLGVKDQ